MTLPKDQGLRELTLQLQSEFMHYDDVLSLCMEVRRSHGVDLTLAEGEKVFKALENGE